MPLDPEANVRDGYLLLTTAARLVQRRHDDALAPLGLTRAAVIALKAVAACPLNQEQLAAKVYVQSQTLGRVLTRLETEGLITRKRDLLDRRQFQVQITPPVKQSSGRPGRLKTPPYPQTSTGGQSSGNNSQDSWIHSKVRVHRGVRPATDPPLRGSPSTASTITT
ncbi:MarR family transcriptional regulator [Arthrobacter sp. OVS8]|nr:MarR family transcriptional regulator [Arthrobacter sp. OVS8]